MSASIYMSSPAVLLNDDDPKDVALLVPVGLGRVELHAALQALENERVGAVESKACLVEWLGDAKPVLSFDELKAVVREVLDWAVEGVRVHQRAAQQVLESTWGVPITVTGHQIPRGRRTLHLTKTLRSGNNLRYDGDVIIMGDVNPGAQVMATGNVVVLGALKGTVHAGASGDENAYVMALLLMPIQVRIGRRIAVSPSSQRSVSDPQVAVVDAGKIVFEPYRRFLAR